MQPRQNQVKMVRHGDGGGSYNHLKYDTRPYAEYRTVVHVAVQMLHPKLAQRDKPTWQHVADIFNHLFAEDLNKQNVRRQDAKHWRDQYVHRESKGRPDEWKKVCLPDDQQPVEEMARREGYRRRIQQAAADLGIQIPAAAATSTAPNPAAAAAETGHQKPKRRLARFSSGDGDPKVPISPPHKKVRGEARRRPTQVPDAQEPDGRKVLRQGKGWVEFAEGGDGASDESEEEESHSNIPTRDSGRLRGAKPYPTYPSPWDTGEMRKSRLGLSSSQAQPSTADDEALAQHLQEQEYGAERTKPARIRDSSTSTSSHDDDGDSNLDPEMQDLQENSRTAVGRARRKTAAASAELSGNKGIRASEVVGHTVPDLDNTNSAPKFKKKKGNGEAGSEMLAGLSKTVPYTDTFLSGSVSVMPGSAAHVDGRPGPEKYVEHNASTSLAPMRSFLESRNTTLVSTEPAPPPLPMIHGDSEETLWIDGIPHASSVTGEDGKAAPAILRPTSLMPKRGSMVLRGVIDDEETDLMVCPADECSWCNPESANSALPTTTRKALGRPLVHACCVKANVMDAVSEFVPIEGLGYEWEDRLPNHVSTGKVRFADGLTREVYVCVEKRCKTCRELRGGKGKSVAEEGWLCRRRM